MALPRLTLLVAESDVIIRLALSEYLRACSFIVLEAADGVEAKAILQSGLRIDAIIADAQLADPAAPQGGSGFALAQWVRRHHPRIDIQLTTSVASKAKAASHTCGRYPGLPPPSSATALAARIRALLAEHKRRERRPSSAAANRRRRKGS
jgi:CheY-like chemotaxis protein